MRRDKDWTESVLSRPAIESDQSSRRLRARLDATKVSRRKAKTSSVRTGSSSATYFGGESKC